MGGDAMLRFEHPSGIIAPPPKKTPSFFSFFQSRYIIFFLFRFASQPPLFFLFPLPSVQAFAPPPLSCFAHKMKLRTVFIRTYLYSTGEQVSWLQNTSFASVCPEVPSKFQQGRCTCACILWTGCVIMISPGLLTCSERASSGPVQSPDEPELGVEKLYPDILRVVGASLNYRQSSKLGYVPQSPAIRPRDDPWEICRFDFVIFLKGLSNEHRLEAYDNRKTSNCPGCSRGCGDNNARRLRLPPGQLPEILAQ